MLDWRKQRIWKPLAVICFLALIGFGGWWFFPRAGTAEKTDPTPENLSAANQLQSQSRTPSVAVAGSSQILAVTKDPVYEAIVRTLKALKDSADLRTNAEALLELTSSLKDPSDHASALAAIEKFLDSSQDAPTSLNFAVRSDGYLASAPSLRVALLDTLGNLDTAEASHYAENIFRHSDIPDEWAIALRDRGRDIGPAMARTDAGYRSRVEELLKRREWLEKPTAGYLHAFDAAVFAGGASMVEQLTADHDAGFNAAVDYAARLALDRLALKDFEVTARVIRSDSTHLSRDPLQRAAIMARADPQNSADAELIAAYVKDTSVGIEEKTYFLNSFPNGNLELSNNLLTSNPFIPLANLSRRDDAATQLLMKWREDPALAYIRPAIENRLRRLGEYATGNR